MILGLGTGYQKSEFHALGVDMDERNALFDEALEALPCTGPANRSAFKAGTSAPGR